uniref:Uncharacterized protein n=1 Tax=Anopheles maculatus TaxID=74869 RepID=A0A2C9H4C9_9DIPT
MVSPVARLWAMVLLLAALHKCDQAAVSERPPTPASSSCLFEAGAVFGAPPITCQPLVACNGEQILKTYLKINENCRIKASARLHEREHFMARLNYWQDDHAFLYGTIVKAHASHQIVLDMERQVEVSTKLVDELNRKLFIYSIEAGRIEDALLLYVTAKDQWKPQQILDEMQRNPSGVNEVLALHMLEFVRALPIKSLRVEMYKAIMAFLRRNNLNSTYVSLLYAGDVIACFTTEKDKKDYLSLPYGVLLHALRNQLRNLEFDFNVWLANKYPRYYTQFLTEIFFFSPAHWPKIEKRRLFEIASLFKAKGHRFQVIEQFLKFAKQYDSRNVAKLVETLPTLALEVDKLRRTVEQTGNHKKEVDQIKSLQDRFKMTVWNRRNHRAYLHIIQTEGKFGKKYKELESKG